MSTTDVHDSNAAGPVAVARRVLGHFRLGQLLRARASVPRLRARPFMLWEGTALTYADVYREASRYGALFRATRHALVARGELEPDAQLAVGIYRDNAPSFVFAVLGAALEGDVIIGLNTGFRGETLATLVERAQVKLLLTSDEQLAHVEQVLPRLRTLGRSGVLVETPVSRDAGAGTLDAPEGMTTLGNALARARGGSPRRPNGSQPLLVVYTSGTTGTPKGIGCSHLKLMGAGILTWRRIGLRSSDRGYVCMPLFHANAWLLGIMPLLLLGGSFVLKRRFSASAFEQDILDHGVTYMNYVGQPIHYILEALEKKYGSPAAVRAALAGDARNRFRIAHGNGATSTDREKLVSYLGMEHVYEIYGSTEAVINTVVQPGDPLDSVGRIGSSRIVILNERGQECPPAVVDGEGRIVNYEAAVGEICARMTRDSVLFEGYYRDPAATRKKYRDGHYHSGDLGHVRISGGKRFLYFDGRTDDWIRKDGENFSAESVARFARELPGVALAVAYGVPSPVSDERVAVALQMREGSTLDLQAAYDRYLQQQREGGMDPTWMPDFVRIVDRLPMTITDKVLVRQLKREHFDLAGHPEMVIYWRQRGDARFRRMLPADYETMSRQFFENGRAHLIGSARPADGMNRREQHVLSRERRE